MMDGNDVERFEGEGGRVVDGAAEAVPAAAVAGGGPPFDGVVCPMCPAEMRALHQVATNLLVRWDDYTHKGWTFNRVVEHMKQLRAAVEASEPLLQAHFADRRHSHGEGK